MRARVCCRCPKSLSHAPPDQKQYYDSASFAAADRSEINDLDNALINDLEMNPSPSNIILRAGSPPDVVSAAVLLLSVRPTPKLLLPQRLHSLHLEESQCLALIACCREESRSRAPGAHRTAAIAPAPAGSRTQSGTTAS